MASVELPSEIDVKTNPSDLDKDGFVSIWNIASASAKGDLEQTRALAAQFLCFLCKRNCDFVITSTTNAEYLDERFERDNKLLYDWNLESEKVDIIAQHAEVPYEPFVSFLQNQKFNPKTKYAPRRVDRVEWFQNLWSTG